MANNRKNIKTFKLLLGTAHACTPCLQIAVNAGRRKATLRHWRGGQSITIVCFSIQVCSHCTGSVFGSVSCGKIKQLPIRCFTDGLSWMDENLMILCVHNFINFAKDFQNHWLKYSPTPSQIGKGFENGLYGATYCFIPVSLFSLAVFMSVSK